VDTKTPAHGDTPRAKLTLLKFKIKIGKPKKNCGFELNPPMDGGGKRRWEIARKKVLF